jgi:hypothetical protein
VSSAASTRRLRWLERPPLIGVPVREIINFGVDNSQVFPGVRTSRP